MHEFESLSDGDFIDHPSADNRNGLDAVQSLTNDRGFRHTTLSGTPFQHALVTRFDIDLFPNHRYLRPRNSLYTRGTPTRSNSSLSSSSASHRISEMLAHARTELSPDWLASRR